MTKEKALEIFKFMLKSGKGTIDYWNGTIAEQRAAIEMAIKALEQEETNKDTDFVPIEIEFIGKKGFGYLYKPQQLIVTGYYALEAFKYFGGKYKEKEGVEDEIN